MNNPNTTNLTFAGFQEVLKTIPKPPPFRYAAVRPEYLSALLDEVQKARLATSLSGSPFAGADFDHLMVQQKPGQRAASWMFTDRKTFIAYMGGDITEDILERWAAHYDPLIQKTSMPEPAVPAS